MCDCYEGACKICGKRLPMHLGDYSTDRHEVDIFCGKCVKKNLAYGYAGEEYCERHSCRDLNARGRMSGSIWYIVSLTENAYENRAVNNPNTIEDHLIWCGSIEDCVKRIKTGDWSK